MRGNPGSWPLAPVPIVPHSRVMGVITDRKQLEVWLTGKSRERAVALALRCAIRVAPQLTSVFDADLSSERKEMLVLQCYRAMLVSGAATGAPDAGLRPAARSAFRSAYGTYSAYAATAPFADAAYAASRSAYLAYSDENAFAVDAASTVDAAARNAGAGLWQAVDADCSRGDAAAPEALLAEPVWPDGWPDWFRSADSGAAGWLNDPEWMFWRRWYRGMRDGEPLPWALQRQIALIPQEDWEAGPVHMADLIARIEAGFNSPAPDETVVQAERARSGAALRRHVRHLLEQSAAAEVNAVGLAWQIRTAIDAHCNATGLNETPEELRAFEAVAGVLARIGGSVAQAGLEGAAREAAVEALETQLAELQLRIRSLEKALAEAKAKEVTGQVAAGFYRGLGTSLSVACTTSVVSAATYFVAPEFSPDIVRHLGDRMMEVFGRSVPQTGGF